MGPMRQSPKAEKKFHALPNNPFVPPIGDTCYINNLPPELLSRIFEVGALDNDDGGAGSLLQGCSEGLEEGYKSGADDDLEMAEDEKVEVADQEEEVEEEEADNEADDTGSSDVDSPSTPFQTVVSLCPEEGYKSGADNDVEEEEEGDDEERTDVPGSSDFDSPSPSFQILVSLVCRHWRNVALSAPSLWTSIKVPSNARSPYENVSILLERSKALPIDLDIDDPEVDDASPEYETPHFELDLKFLYSLLVPHVQRWRSIVVNTLTYHSIYTFLSAVSDPSVPAASQLATLELYHYTGYDVLNIQPKLSNHFTLFGGSAPNLTTLSLHEVHVDWNQDWIASASNLRYLKLKWQPEDVRPTWAQFATILRGAPQLRTLILYESGPSGEPAEWVFKQTPGRSTGDLNAPIQLLNLTDFHLISDSPSHAIGFFPKLYLPSLKSLTLCLSGGDYTDLIDQLAGPAISLSHLSAQEQPRSLLNSLENLTIWNLPCGSEGVEILYSELQNLQSLNISPSYLFPQVFDILCQPCTLPGRGDIWLPRLKSLWICGALGDMIRHVVQKRKDAGVPLKALYVDNECDVDDDNAEWFRENVETFALFERSRDVY